MNSTNLKPVTRTFDILDRLQEIVPNKEDILARKINGNTLRFSVKEYRQHAYEIAYALVEMGYEAGDKAITITPNRPEWNIIDMGLNLAGMVHVPIYPTLNQTDFLYIFNHSDARIRKSCQSNVAKIRKNTANHSIALTGAYKLPIRLSAKQKVY